MKLVVIDGQGGRLGKLLVELLRARLPQAQILAVGTNSIATAAMLKAGAHWGATGENPVIRGAILGEVTPAMAEAVAGCSARKYLIPMNSCGVAVAGVQDLPLSAYAERAVEMAAEALTNSK